MKANTIFSFAGTAKQPCACFRDAGGKPDHGYALSLGAARRLPGSGGLVKGRLDHTGQVALLYQQQLPGLGQLALTCQLDPLSLAKVAPAVGFALDVA